MSMNKLMIAGIAGTFLASSAAMAMEPVKLTDGQMDDVTAGFDLVAGLAFTGGGGTAASGLAASGYFKESSRTGTYESDTLSVKDSGSGLTLSGTSTTSTSASAKTSGGFSALLGGGQTISLGTFAASGTLRF